MVWNHEKKLIFVHIPKTGGTTVESVMKLNKEYKGCGYGSFYGKALQHLTFHGIKRIVGDEIFDEYEKISIYRNPYSRMVSEYYWCEISGIGHSSKQDFDSFLDYVEKCVKNRNFDETIHHDHFMPQHEFVFNHLDKLMVDKLFNFDNFHSVKKFLLEEYDYNIGDAKCLKNNRSNKIKLNTKQKRRIYNIYKKDFDLFNIDPELEEECKYSLYENYYNVYSYSLNN